LKPLLYLELRQFINALKNTLRSPRRLIPALLIGAGVFAWIAQAALFLSGAAPPPHQAYGLLAAVQNPSELIKAGSFLFLSFGSLVIIYQAFSTGSLVFSIAHIDFLFPTPISRRSVLLIKLLKDYLKYMFWVTFFVTFTGAPIMLALHGSLFPYGFVSIAALTAYVLFLVNMAHTVNIVFTFGFEKLKQAGKLVKLVLGLAFASAILVGVHQYAASGDSYFSVHEAANSPVIKAIFAPADWCSGLLVAPLLRSVTDSEMIHLGFLWALAFASFGLLLSRKENIYEPSLGVSVRAVRVRQAMRSGDVTAVRVQMMQEKGRKAAGLLVIPPFGRGAVALLWKSLLIRYRMSWHQLALMLVLPGIIVFVIQRSLAAEEIMRNLPFILLYMAFLMSITVQPQVRAELKHANILKSMPISAWKMMLVGAVNGSIYLTAGILVFAVSMWVFVPATRTDLLKTCAIGSASLGFACVSATMIPALLYPDMRDQAQNFFCNLFGIMMVSVAIIPTIVLGAVLLALAGVSYYVALVPICVVNVIIGAAAVSISGAIFRRFDPTSE